MTPSPTCPPELSLPQLLAQTFVMFVDDLYVHLRTSGYDDLRPTHFLNVFMYLDINGKRPSELARLAGMTPQSMGELISYLEERAYVERKPDPTDRRSRIVVYAERGLDAALSAEAFFRDLDALWVTDAGSDDADAMRRAFAAILASNRSRR